MLNNNNNYNSSDRLVPLQQFNVYAITMLLKVVSGSIKSRSSVTIIVAIVEKVIESLA